VAKDKIQEAYNRGLINGANLIRADFIAMLKKELDVENDPNAECPACKITTQYIQVLEDTQFKLTIGE
jgi:hypothetical protein